ncbi:hypothetical protein J3F84DRAFT_361859 [Trichoderma pleuroticola]
MHFTTQLLTHHVLFFGLFFSPYLSSLIFFPASPFFPFHRNFGIPFNSVLWNLPEHEANHVKPSQSNKASSQQCPLCIPSCAFHKSFALTFRV